MTKLITLVASLLLLGVSPTRAQDYPTKVITMIVPFAAGGPTDTVARLIAVPMSNTLKQQVIVENPREVPAGRLPPTESQRRHPTATRFLYTISACPLRRRCIESCPITQ